MVKHFYGSKLFRKVINACVGYEEVGLGKLTPNFFPGPLESFWRTK
jgi:hypothetical protein